MFFSVVIPTYKRPNELNKCLLELENQVFKDFEVIVVDDNVPSSVFRKRTESVIFNFTIYPIRYIKNDSNKGANYSRNVGIDCAKGKYIALLDDDDLFEPEKLNVIHNEIIKRGSNVDFLYTASKRVVQNTGDYTIQFVHYPSHQLKREILAHNFPGSNSFVVFKKSLWLTCGKFDEKLESAQDWDLWIRMILSNAIVHAIPKPLVTYTISNSTNRITKNYDKRINGYNKVCLKYKHKLKNFSLIERMHILRIQSNSILNIYYENDKMVNFRKELYGNILLHFTNCGKILKALLSYFSIKI